MTSVVVQFLVIVLPEANHASHFILECGGSLISSCINLFQQVHLCFDDITKLLISQLNGLVRILHRATYQARNVFHVLIKSSTESIVTKLTAFVLLNKVLHVLAISACGFLVREDRFLNSLYTTKNGFASCFLDRGPCAALYSISSSRPLHLNRCGFCCGCRKTLIHKVRNNLRVRITRTSNEFTNSSYCTTNDKITASVIRGCCRHIAVDFIRSLPLRPLRVLLKFIKPFTSASAQTY